MFKMDRQLIVVKYVTWLPASERDALQGNLGNTQKIEAVTCVWAPYPVDEHGSHAPEKMDAVKQGVPWAYQEVARRKPDGREVLLFIGANETGILESKIINQPKGTDAEGDLGIRTAPLVGL